MGHYESDYAEMDRQRHELRRNQLKDAQRKFHNFRRSLNTDDVPPRFKGHFEDFENWLTVAIGLDKGTT